MSKKDVPQSASDAAPEHSNQQPQSEDAPHTTTPYQAPYYRREQGRVPGEYMVRFKERHTLKKHFIDLGLEFDVIDSYFSLGYGAKLNDQLFNAVRSDPGVRAIEDNTSDWRDGHLLQWLEGTAQKSSIQSTSVAPHAIVPYQAPYYPHKPKRRLPGRYIVKFHEDYTIERHFAFLGLEFEAVSLGKGYVAHLDDQLFNAVRHDSGVELIEDTSKGKGRD